MILVVQSNKLLPLLVLLRRWSAHAQSTAAFIDRATRRVHSPTSLTPHQQGLGSKGHVKHLHFIPKSRDFPPTL